MKLKSIVVFKDARGYGDKTMACIRNDDQAALLSIIDQDVQINNLVEGAHESLIYAWSMQEMNDRVVQGTLETVWVAEGEENV